MIYTSYFGNIGNLPSTVFPISIARIKPIWFKGADYPKLAPSIQLLKDYKCGFVDENQYKKIFMIDTLSKCDPFNLIDELETLRPLEVYESDESIIVSPFKHIALLCYEAPDKFCHRHIIAKWFRNAGINVNEFDNHYLFINMGN